MGKFIIEDLEKVVNIDSESILVQFSAHFSKGLSRGKTALFKNFFKKCVLIFKKNLPNFAKNFFYTKLFSPGIKYTHTLRT